jgi:D-glycero-alpha-D-manno-heptose 1-phosphate guanylyltransferase
MEAIILAGGFGTRLRGLVSDVPKPMAPIAGKPFLEILLSSMANSGFNRILLSVGYMADKIKNYFGLEYRGIELVYVEEIAPLGTGGAVRLAMEKTISNHVYIFNGDTLLELDVAEVEKQWILQGRSLIVCKAMPDTARYGRVLDNKGVVEGFIEKGMSGPGLINAGCYVLKKGALDSFPLGTAFSLEQDFLKPAVLKEDFGIFQASGQFIDIGIPEDFLRAQKLFVSCN